MENKKKPWVKPTITFHPAGSDEYNRIMALIRAENEKNQEQEQTSVAADSAEKLNG